MCDKKSEKIIQEYLKQEPKLNRSSIEFTITLDATADKIFPLLCPAVEADWIPGWNAKIIYSSTGYAEDKCIFTTDEKSSSGEGLWTFTRFEINKLVEFVRVNQDVLFHVSISVNENKDGTSTVIWKKISSALTIKGNTIIENQMSAKEMKDLYFKLIDDYLKNNILY